MTIRLPQRTGALRSVLVLLTTALSLAGCASLPSSGPTGPEIRRAAEKPSEFPFVLVEVESAAEVPPGPGPAASAALNIVRQPTDLLGPGDVINVTIYEAGVTLFGDSGLRSTGSATPSFDPSSTAERLPAIRVDDDGFRPDALEQSFFAMGPAPATRFHAAVGHFRNGGDDRLIIDTHGADLQPAG